MRYMFQVLVLGDPLLNLPYIVNGGVEHVSQDFELSRWSRSLNVGNHQCDLEIDVPVTNADYDSIIQTCDGILYFLDPNNPQEFELFDMIAHIILEVRHEISLIVVFYTQDGFIKIPANYLLEYIWENYPFEAFIFNQYSNNKLNELLECLSDGIISQNIPVNIETAWIRIPFFIRKINKHIFNEQWEDAAKYTKLLTEIKKKFNDEDYLINAEQAAWLYSKSGSYLKASKMLDNINDLDAEKFRKLYVEDLMHQGDQLYKMKRFRQSAEKYEKSALWAAIEIEEEEIGKRAYMNAINTWISACEFQKSFKLIERFDHNIQLETLIDLTPKIAKAADFLIANKNFDIAKSQLYLCIDKYQRSGLFDEVKILGEKIVTVLKILIKLYIEESNPSSALLTVDELFNIWETFGLEKANIDQDILKICNLFLEKDDFGIIDNLIPYIESMDIQKTINESRIKAEEDFQRSQKNIVLADYSNAVLILEKYITDEFELFSEDTSGVLTYINELKVRKEYWDAALILKEKSSWFKKIGHNKIYNKLQSALLDLYLESGQLLLFSQEIKNLSSDERTNYLNRNSGKLIIAVENLFEKNETAEKVSEIMEILINVYRNHLLYEESKELAKMHAKYLVHYSSEKIFTTKGLDEVPNALNLLKQADMIYHSISEKEFLNYDNILEEIVKRYIEVDNLSRAAQINEQIKDRSILAGLHEIIAKKEEEESEKRIKNVQKTANWQIQAEELSLLKNLARDVLMNKQNLFRSRNAVKRIYFKEILDSLSSEDFETAIELCKKSTIALTKRRKLDFSGISLAIICLILIKTDSIDRLASIINEINVEIDTSSVVFKELFPVKIVNYVKEMFEFNEYEKAEQALALLKNLPLFDEEQALLFSVLEKVKAKSIESGQSTSQINAGVVDGIGKDASEISQNSLSSNQENSSFYDKDLITKLITKLEPRIKLFPKRKMMRKKYWNSAIEFLSSQSYSEAAQEYINQMDFLGKNNHNEFIPVALAMGIASYIKLESYAEGRKILERKGLSFGNHQKTIEKYPEYPLLEYLLTAKENKNEIMANHIIDGFIQNLPLFDIEKSFMANLSEKDTTKRVSESESVKNAEDLQVTLILNQQLGNLKQSTGDINSISDKLLKKRNAMRRIYYNPILEKLAVRDFEGAADHYQSVAMRITQRNDYDMAGILILIGAIALMKVESGVEKIKAYERKFLDKLGFTEKVINETFGIKLLNFLIEAKNIEHEVLIEEGWNLVKILPLFEEEKELLQ